MSDTERFLDEETERAIEAITPLRTDDPLVDALRSRIRFLIEEAWAKDADALLQLAKLASDTPQFFNPLDAWAARGIRDSVLESAGLKKAPTKTTLPLPPTSPLAR